MSLATGTGRASHGPFHPAHRIVTWTILALVTVTAFETMAVSTAMPDVARELDAVRSYGFAFSVLMTTQLLGIVLAGVWSDRSGPFPGTLTGQVLLAGGSAICGLSTNFGVFLLGRALTGLGGGLLIVMMYVIAGRVYSDEVRPALFTYIAGAWLLPSLIGPWLSARLTEDLTWRLVFWCVVPPVLISIASMVYARSHVSRLSLDVATSSRDHGAHVRAAWWGLLIAVSAGAVQLAIHRLSTHHSPPVLVGLLGVLGVIIAAPRLVPEGTWRMRPGLPSVLCARAVLTAAFFGGVSYLPLFLHDQRGASLQLAGLAIAVGSLGWAVGAYVQGRPELAIQRHRLVTLGGAFLAGGLVLLAVIAALNFKGAFSVLALILCGLGMGLGVTTTTVMALELSPVEDHGENSSALQLADVLGSVVGIALATAIFAAHHVPRHDNGLFGVIFLVMGLIGALAVPAGQRINT